MTAPIGVIAGMNEELQNLMTRKAFHRHLLGVDFYIDEHEGRRVILAHAGCGKVAAAHAASILITKFGVEALVVTGTAGATDPADVGNTYLITHAFQHDYGAEQADQRTLYRPGNLPIGEQETKPGFYTDATTLEQLCLALEQNIDDRQLGIGTIATGDVFMNGTDAYVKALFEEGVDLIDMETAAIAQVATMAGVPWVAAKSASDGAGTDSAEQFQVNLEQAAGRAAELTRRVIQLF